MDQWHLFFFSTTVQKMLLSSTAQNHHLQVRSIVSFWSVYCHVPGRWSLQRNHLDPRPQTGPPKDLHLGMDSLARRNIVRMPLKCVSQYFPSIYVQLHSLGHSQCILCSTGTKRVFSFFAMLKMKNNCFLAYVEKILSEKCRVFFLSRPLSTHGRTPSRLF